MSVQQDDQYDVLVVGGGIVGPAVVYVAAGWTNAPRIALLEKEDGLSQVASGHEANSQTLHFGDIETNMALAQALRVQGAAELVAAYLQRHAHEGGLSVQRHKMCLAVGDAEIARLRARYEELRPHYPKIRFLTRDEIARLEPNVVAGRDPREPIAALFSPDGFIVNYGRLAESFEREAKRRNAHVETFTRTRVERIERTTTGYAVHTNRGTFHARAVAVTAGGYSLVLAKSLGYGRDWELIPVAGSFYRTRRRNCLIGKVYTEQNPDIPFAAPHGDPEVMTPDETRFGPTAKLIPLLERHRWGTFWGFLRTVIWNPRGLWAYAAVLVSSPVLLKFVIRNLFLDLPIVGKWMYLRDIRKIVPSMGYDEVELAEGIGGIRPQIVNIRERTLKHGEGKIVGLRGDPIVFLITPSPGASVCLRVAEETVTTLVEFLGPGYAFDRERFERDHRREPADPAATAQA